MKNKLWYLVALLITATFGVLALSGCTPERTEAATTSRLTAERFAFLNAASAYAGDAEARTIPGSIQTTVLHQVGGHNMPSSAVVTIQQLYDTMNRDGWMHHPNGLSLNYERAIFGHGNNVTFVTLVGHFPSAVDVVTGTTYVAQGGFVFRLLDEDNQPPSIVVDAMYNAVFGQPHGAGTAIDAVGTIVMRRGIRLDQTIYGTHIGQHLWGFRGIYASLLEGVPTPDPWMPVLARVTHTNPPWTGIANPWYLNGVSIGRVEEGTPGIRMSFPQLPHTNFNETQRLLSEFTETGLILAANMHSGLGLNGGAGVPRPPTNGGNQGGNNNQGGNQGGNNQQPPDLLPPDQLPPGNGGNNQTPPPQQQRTVRSIAVTPATASIRQGESQQFSAVVTFSDNTTETNPSNLVWTINATAAHNVTISGRTVNAAANATPAVYTVRATVGGISGEAQLTVTARAVQSNISLSPSSVVIDGRGGSATTTLTSTHQWAVSDWGGFNGTLNLHTAAAGTHSLTVTLPQNPGMVRVFRITFRNNQGDTAVLIVDQNRGPGTTPGFVPADPPPGGVTRPPWGEDTNNSGTPDYIFNPNPGNPVTHPTHPQHNPNDPNHPGQTVIPDLPPLPPECEDDVVDLTPPGQDPGWDN
ncbi:Ig-like domain-containing protein [Candidatus Saccharibacteria bacterium]|nr:Ig-like domain-containing protein [Candidatus Saccharibacteria bacterium]